MKPSTIKHALLALDWTGHIEISDRDINWLSNSLAASLFPSDAFVCGVCGSFKDITVETKIGRICEDCIDDMSYAAEEQREEMEE